MISINVEKIYGKAHRPLIEYTSTRSIFRCARGRHLLDRQTVPTVRSNYDATHHQSLWLRWDQKKPSSFCFLESLHYYYCY